jgi:hypothetical protein
MKTFLIRVLSIAELLTLSTPSIAQWDAKNDVLIFSDTTETEIIAPHTLGQVLSDKNGGAWVLWGRSRYDSGIGDSSAIYLQHLDSNGYATLTPNGLRLTDPGFHQVLGDDFVTDDGTLHIAYRVMNANVLFDSMYIQKITASGTKVFGPNGIKLPNFTGQNTSFGNYYNGMVASTDSSFLIAYTASGIPVHGIYIQKFDKDGAMLFGDTGKPIATYEFSNGHHFSPSFYSLNSDGNGGAYVTFTDNLHQSDSILLQHIRSDGSLQFSKYGIGLCKIGGQLSSHRVSVTPTKAGFVMTTTFRLSLPLAVNTDITIFTFDSLGNHLNGEGGVPIYTDSNGSTFQLLSKYPDENGSLLYFYKSPPDRSTSKGPVYARKVSSNGDELWTPPKYIGNGDSSMGDVSISNTASGFSGIWDIGDSSTTLIAQMIDGNGNKVWQDQGVMIGSNLPSYRFNPHQDRDQYGNCIACWNDSRNFAYPHSEIYCAKIDTTGFLPTVVQKSVHFSSDREISVRLYPNPAQTFLSYVISDGVNPYRVTITDELGRQLWEGKEHSGKIDIRSFGKGTYFLSIESKEKVEPIPFIIY